MPKMGGKTAAHTYWLSKRECRPGVQDPNLFITVSLDARVLYGTRSSAVAVLTTKSHIFSTGYHQATVAVMLCSVGTQCKLNKDKVRKKNHKCMELNSVNILRMRQNGRHFQEDIFQHIFVNENEWISIKISLKFVPKCQINTILALVQIMAWCRPGDKPLSQPMTLPQWFKARLWNAMYIYEYIYINFHTRTNKSKSLITLDNKKSHGAARFPVRQLEIYYCFICLICDHLNYRGQ